MSCEIDDVMELCCKILAYRQITETVDNSYKGAAAASGGAFIGGLVGGPPGIFVGGALGGAVGWWMTSGKFCPLHEIIMEMTPKKKEKLYSQVKRVLGNLKWDNLAELISKVMCNSSLQNAIHTTVFDFFTVEFGVVGKYEYK